MKKNLTVIIFIIAAFMVVTLPVSGDSAQDYKVIKKASKGKKSGDLNFFKLTVYDTKAKKNTVKITLPLALVDMLAECEDDAKILDKTDIDLEKILAAVAKLPLSTWAYNHQDDSERHMGPVAEDFFAAFGLGKDAKHVAPSDLAAVALATAKALQLQLAEKDRDNAILHKRLDALEARLSKLDRQ